MDWSWMMGSDDDDDDDDRMMIALDWILGDNMGIFGFHFVALIKLSAFRFLYIHQNHPMLHMLFYSIRFIDDGNPICQRKLLFPAISFHSILFKGVYDILKSPSLTFFSTFPLFYNKSYKHTHTYTRG